MYLLRRIALLIPSSVYKIHRMKPTTIADLCELTGYSRDQMRGLLAELPRFSNRQSEARRARVYSNHDVLLVAILCRLEMRYGLKRHPVASLCEAIAAEIALPRTISRDARLVLDVEAASCQYVEGVPSLANGLVFPLDPIFCQIDAYLTPPPLLQREVRFSSIRPLAPRPLPSRKQPGKRASMSASPPGNERHRHG